MLPYIGIFIPFVALSIPIIALVLSYGQKTQKNKIREMELQKEILALELEKQNGRVKLLEEENKKYDRLLNGPIENPGEDTALN
jgi:cell shape-determining protein MreC